MNNGSLLTNLLAINNASPVTKKSMQASKAASSAEQFQKTFNDLRPKVAASKPEPRPAARVGEPETNRSRKTDQGADAHASKSTESNAARQKKTAERPENANQAELNRRPPKTNHSASEVNTKSTAEPASSELEQASLNDDSQAAELVAEPLLLGVPENLEQAQQLSETAALALGAAERQLNAQVNLNSDLQADAALLASGELDPFVNQLLSVGEPALDLSAESADTETVAIPTLAVPTQVANTATALGVAAAAAGQTVANAATLSAQPPGQLTEDPMAEAISAALTPEAELGANESMDNPDFLLLNAKNIMAKLAESAGASVDKVVANTDVPKSLSAAMPALEAAGRLSEAQTPAARAFVVQTGVPVALGQPQWGKAVGERVLWLAAQNVSAAEIRLDPPELGPMQVRVSLNQEQVNVSFTSPHPVVREVLDQQLNRLREMFAEQGLNLVDVDVSDKSFAQQDQEKHQSSKGGAMVEEDEDLAGTLASSILSTRLVDHYA